MQNSSNSPALNGQGFEADSISVFDQDNPRSVVNILPDRMSEALKNLPEKYRALSEKDARTKFRPSPAMNQMRAAFWLEYNRAQSTFTKKMEMAPIYTGIVTRDYFETVVCKSKEMIAWMLIPPQGYQAVLNEAWEAGMAQMRAVLDLPVVDKKGKISTSVIAQQIRIFTLLDQRKNGGFVQKNMNLNLTGDDAKAAMSAVSMEEIDKRLAALDKRLNGGSVVSTEVEKEVKPINE